MLFLFVCQVSLFHNQKKKKKERKKKSIQKSYDVIKKP